MINFQLIMLSAVSVTGLTDWLKTFDKEGKLKRFYNLYPLFLSIITALGASLYEMKELQVGAWILYAVTTLSISTLAYDTIIEWIKNKIAKS